MIFFLLCLVTALLGIELADGSACPRRLPRALKTASIRWLGVCILFGALNVLTGSPAFSAVLLVTLAVILALSSDVKRKILGEPLVFSDLVVAGSFLREPKFYLHAITLPARIATVLITPVLVTGLVYVSWHGSLIARSAGLVLTSLAVSMLFFRLTKLTDMSVPYLSEDFKTHGPWVTTLVYWWRWNHTTDPASLPPLLVHNEVPEIVVIIQCESFCDAAIGTESSVRLANLEQARARASHHGHLLVSGFGAYTMRTEYGVLCGREEDALGFRSFDPFLTAGRETSYALPNKLAAFFPNRVFIHPHDMRFYGRESLMPRMGFTALQDEASFRNALRVGPYIADAEIAARIGEIVESASAPTLVYAVTMENHGPWPKNRLTDINGPGSYIHHRHNGDAMLGAVMDHLEKSGKRALLVFFGDHRPSIPGASEPGAERHTPYAVIPFPLQARQTDATSLTPAGLHHVILSAIGHAETAMRCRLRD